MKIALATAYFHGFGVARAGPWNTWVNRRKEKSRIAEERSRRRLVIMAAMALYFVTMDIKSADPQLPVGSRTSCARPFSLPWRPSYP